MSTAEKFALFASALVLSIGCMIAYVLVGLPHPLPWIFGTVSGFALAYGGWFVLFGFDHRGR